MGREGRSDSQIEAFVEGLQIDYQAINLEPVDRAILDYAMKLTRTPADVCREDVEALRSCGLDDRAIHDLACIVSYFAFVNRVSDGLGVELESDGDTRF